MGQAFDRDGKLLGEAEGDTPGEVLRALEREFKQATTFQIHKLEQRHQQKEREELAQRLLRHHDDLVGPGAQVTELRRDLLDAAKRLKDDTST